MFHSFGKMDFTEISVWINKLRIAVRIPKLIGKKLRIWRKYRNINTLDHLEIPSEWQNTLAKKYPKMMSPSLSSSTSSFASSTSSSHSVPLFPNNIGIRQDQVNHSTPIKSLLSINRMGARKQQTTIVHDISGVKIYEDDDSDRVVTNNDDTDDCYQTIIVMNRFLQN